MGCALDIGRMLSGQLFPGQYADAETGFNDNGFRTYDPSLGRYLQNDPVGVLKDFSAPELQVARRMGIPFPSLPKIGETNHLYGYASQNPVMRVDPSGLADCSLYAERCKEDPGEYYCDVAPAVCENYPPVPSEKWANCVRTCLQQKDSQCDKDPNSCNEGPDMTCITRIHKECWTQCDIL